MVPENRPVFMAIDSPGKPGLYWGGYESTQTHLFRGTSDGDFWRLDADVERLPDEPKGGSRLLDALLQGFGAKHAILSDD